MFFIFSRYSYQKMVGEKTTKIFFQKHTNSASKKCWERISERSAKNFFYIHTDIVTKKWREKNARNNFYRRTRIVRGKNFGIKIVGKSAKNVFIFTQISSPENGGENTRETIFTEAHEQSGQKIFGKNCSKKVPKNIFFIITRISCPKNWGKKHAK